MRVAFSLNSRTSRLRPAIVFTFCLAAPIFAAAQDSNTTPPSANVAQEAGPPKRIPRQQALTSSAIDGVVREQVSEGVYRPVAGACFGKLDCSRDGRASRRAKEPASSNRCSRISIGTLMFPTAT